MIPDDQITRKGFKQFFVNRSSSFLNFFWSSWWHRQTRDECNRLHVLGKALRYYIDGEFPSSPWKQRPDQQLCSVVNAEEDGTAECDPQRARNHAGEQAETHAVKCHITRDGNKPKMSGRCAVCVLWRLGFGFWVFMSPAPNSRGIKQCFCLTCLFVCLGFNGTFSTNRLYRAITVG